MDIEKLIERLRTDSLYADKASLEIMDLCMDAAAAIDTLRAEVEQEHAHRIHAEQHADAFLRDCEQLNAELERVTAERDTVEQNFREFTKQWWEEDNGFPCRFCKFENSGGTPIFLEKLFVNTKNVILQKVVTTVCMDV